MSGGLKLNVEQPRQLRIATALALTTPGRLIRRCAGGDNLETSGKARRPLKGRTMRKLTPRRIVKLIALRLVSANVWPGRKQPIAGRAHGF